jgi:hypothetical protein
MREAALGIGAREWCEVESPAIFHINDLPDRRLGHQRYKSGNDQATHSSPLFGYVILLRFGGAFQRSSAQP